MPLPFARENVNGCGPMELAFISAPDMMIVMAIALVVFGPKRLPEIGRQLGGLVRELRKTMGQITDAVEGIDHDVRKVIRDPVPTTSSYYSDMNRRPDSELMKPYDQREALGASHSVESAAISGEPGERADDVVKSVKGSLEPQPVELSLTTASPGSTTETVDGRVHPKKDATL